MFEAILLLVLLAAWGAVLLPSVLRSRTQSTHLTVGGFANSMQALRRHADGRELMVPGQPDRIVRAEARGVGVPVTPARTSPVVERRRAWFTRLLGATVASFLLALVVGGATWVLFIATGLVAGGYTGLLRTLKLQRDESRRVVHHVDDWARDAHDDVDARAWGDEYRRAHGRLEQDHHRVAAERAYHDEGPIWDEVAHRAERRTSFDEPRWDSQVHREPVAVGGGAPYRAPDSWGDSSTVRVRRFR